jgi:hypothetical protein
LRHRPARGTALGTASLVLGIVAIIVGLIFVAIWVGIIVPGIKEDNYRSCLQKAGSDRFLQQLCVK